MTKQKSSRKQIVEIILIALIILCISLIVVEIGSNLSAELISQNQVTTNGQETLPTPYHLNSRRTARIAFQAC